MLDFIRRNKVFSVCFSFCLVIILFLSTLLTLKKLNIDENILVLPIIHPNKELVDPEFTLFKGNFDDENNTIFLTWDYKLNSHSFQKVEIYHENQMIGTYYDERQINIPILSNDICTGYNEFEVILYYDNGMAVTSNTTVFVDYIFDITTSRLLIDNNVGKGYLYSISYIYNTNTPVGYPTLEIDTNYSSAFGKVWKWNQLPQIIRTPLNNDFQKIQIDYLIQLSDFVENDVEWKLEFKFNSVGIRHVDEFVENLSTLEVYTDDMEK